MNPDTTVTNLPVHSPLLQQLAALASLEDRLRKAPPHAQPFVDAVSQATSLILQGVIDLLALSAQATEVASDD